ncbi:MAG: flagellar basal body-associated FliL family protein [Rhodobacteraceae bacterium]|nr:flagellar basal body-associated FliL family protein [Paracoccaceae bacterium]
MNAPAEVAAAPRKRRLLPLLIGLLLAVAAGGGSFYAVRAGLLFGEGGHAPAAGGEEEVPVTDAADVAFLPLEPLIVSLGEDPRGRHLRFAAQIEVAAAHAEEAAKVAPRFVDAINTYLRAADAALLADPNALPRIRAHLLRRLQLIAGQGRVRDVLITEFVVN